ncbi:MAG: hypothetical protein AAF658_01840, partial [Myxococcota bacterium]
TGNTRAVRFPAPAGAPTLGMGTVFGAADPNSVGELTAGGGIAAVAISNGSVFASLGNFVAQYDSAGDDEQRRFGDGGLIGANSLGSVGGIDFDSTGSMYVSDTANNRILIFDSPLDQTDTLEATTADFVIGQQSFSTATGGLARDQLTAPRGIALDGQDRLWVADTGNNRVLLFSEPRTLNSDGRVDATFVLGQVDFSSAARLVTNGAIGARTLDAPTDVTTNEAGNLVFVADQGNNRVLRFTDAERLRITDGPGVFEVTPGETITVEFTTNIAATLALTEVFPEAAVTLTDSTVSFNATGFSAGEIARAEITASVAGPPAQSAVGSVTFQVVQTTTVATPSPPGSRAALARDDGGCECNNFGGPWLAILGVFALVRRRRRRNA